MIVLRAITAADLPLLFEHQCDLEACRMAAFPLRTREEFMAHHEKIRADAEVVQRAVVCEGSLAGFVASFIGPVSCREVCYWIGREFWDRGIASQALAALLKEESRRPLWAHVAKRNAASARVLAKCGFVSAGEDRYENRGGEQVEEFVFKLEL